jgi:predicted ester cyclase
MALACLDRVVQRIACYGTRLGEFCGVRPTGEQAAFASIEINRAGADRKFAGHWSWAGLPGVLHRLGVAPELSPASAPKG